MIGKPFTAIDTPGHDDPDGADIDSPEAREALGRDRQRMTN